MRKLLILVFSLGFYAVMAQDETVKEMKTTAQRSLNDDTTHKVGWKFGAEFNLGLAQGSTSNWAAGGEEFSLSLNGYLNLYANYKKNKSKWINSLQLFYALVNTTSQGIRKNDDRIDFYSKYTYQWKPKLALAVVGNLRTQFTAGYDYSVEPKKRISDWFAPAYITLGPGLDWTVTPYLNVFISPLSGRWTVVSNYPFELAPIYDVDPYQKVKIELGGYISAMFERELAKNFKAKSRLDLYSNYLKNPQNIDIFWTNILEFKINKFLSVVYNFDLIYDDDIRIFGPNNDAPGTQIKSLLSIGLSGKL